MAERGFFSIKDAALWASISTRTLTRWIAKGLPTYHAGPGTKRLVRTEDIVEFLTRQQESLPDLNKVVDEVMRALSSKGNK